ncbi:MAG: trigger factor [Brevinematia bacterium]
MRVEVEEGNLGIFLYKVYLSEDEIGEVEERAYDYWRKEANIPGYRKGMAPRNLIYQKYAQEIRKTFREILTEKIKNEISKKHPSQIDSIVIIDQQVKKDESLIEVPGQVSRTEYVFIVKVSSTSDVIIDNVDELKELLKNISIDNYYIIEDSIDFDEFKRFFFSTKKAEDSLKSENIDKYIVNLFIKVGDEIPTINMHLYLKDFSKLSSALKGKKLLEEVEVSLEAGFRKVIQNYLHDLGVNSDTLKDKVKVTISEILLLEDDDEIIKKNQELFINSYGPDMDFNKFATLVLASILEKNSINRLMGIVISKVIGKYKVYIGEKDYISNLVSSIYKLLMDYSYTPLHVSMYNLNLTMYSALTFRDILEKTVMNVLYKVILNKTPREDESIEELYQSLKGYCSVQDKGISYKEFRENMSYLLFDFISHNV